MKKTRKKIDLRAESSGKIGGFDQTDKERISLDTCYAEKNIPQNDRFVVSRILGHQEIENGHSWCIRD